MTRAFAAFFILILIGAISNAEEYQLRVTVIDADTRKTIPARLYLTNESGQSFFFTSDTPGDAVKYKKQNWINKNSVEYHTTVVANSVATKLPSGKYRLVVERGKSWFPAIKTIVIKDQNVDATITLKRWVNMAERGWYSGDLHIHRTVDELRNIALAENLNVTFPLTYWVTLSDTAPTMGNKNQRTTLPKGLMKLDDDHVVWPRNTEYEIFSIGKTRHTLGALFILGHQRGLKQTVPPWKPVIDANRSDGVVFDMDKLDWPFSMALPSLAKQATYELANNHMWRTDFAFSSWNSPAPNFMQPPFGSRIGGEREWIDYTLGVYYTLLNCGLRLPPSAGTANGVHPVPAGFGRVYVHQSDGFDYRDWLVKLKQGRSFVTTGPMLFATAQGNDPGHVFRIPVRQNEANPVPVEIESISEQPLSYGELIWNGKPIVLLRPQNRITEHGAFRSLIRYDFEPTESGWLAIRFWEERPNGRIRYAHSAPWYFEVDQQPIRITVEEKEYLVARMQTEMKRSRDIVSEAAMKEYQTALEYYLNLPEKDDTDHVNGVRRKLPQDSRRDRWLRNMIVDHQFTPHEIRLATGLSLEDARKQIVRIQSKTSHNPNSAELKVLPYPGGRHPRRGFLDGAIAPQRETKVSIFPPWKDGSYVVVDVPEAVFSNLGLTYLAHEHIPTIWTKKKIELDPLEWKRDNNDFVLDRTLPNNIRMMSRVTKKDDWVAMKMSLTNGTNRKLTGLRVQVCTMLKGLIGFNRQQTSKTIKDGAWIAMKSHDGNRWLITAWEPNHRVWENPPVPCLHSDPIFPDCDPGKTVTIQGGLWFYEGDDIQRELQRVKGVFKSR